MHFHYFTYAQTIFGHTVFSRCCLNCYNLPLHLYTYTKTRKTKHENQHSRQLTIIGNLRKSSLAGASVWACAYTWVCLSTKEYNTFVSTLPCMNSIENGFYFIYVDRISYDQLKTTTSNNLCPTHSTRRAQHVHECVLILWCVLSRF